MTSKKQYHLAGQPAAPVHCPGCATELGGDCPECLRTAAEQPAAPAEFEVQGRCWPAGTHPTRTAAEQRVLDACRDARFVKWEGADGIDAESLGRILQAELARREGK